MTPCSSLAVNDKVLQTVVSTSQGGYTSEKKVAMQSRSWLGLAWIVEMHQIAFSIMPVMLLQETDSKLASHIRALDESKKEVTRQMDALLQET